MIADLETAAPIIYGVEGKYIEYIIESRRLLTERYADEFQIQDYRVTVYLGDQVTIYFDHVDLMHNELRPAPFYQISIVCEIVGWMSCEVVPLSGNDSE